jgi:uncharacterized protein (DUF1697 family)
MVLSTFVALLRGINVGGHNPVPMAELRSLCEPLGWQDVRSYIQSGNLVFQAEAAAAELEAEIEREIERHFGLVLPVIVRTAAQWRTYLGGNPFPEDSEREPNRVLLALSKAPPASDAADRLRGRAAGGEQIAQVGEALWIHYPGGAGRSKLTPGVLDRLVGSPVTTRNWRTVLQLGSMIGPMASEAPRRSPVA